MAQPRRCPSLPQPSPGYSPSRPWLDPGRGAFSHLRPWLQSIANGRAIDPRGLAFWDKVAHVARTNGTVVGLGFRMSTVAMDGIGAALNSVGEVDAFIRDPRARGTACSACPARRGTG